MLQDTFNRLFSGNTLKNRGTLFQLKNEFGHRNVTSDVMNSFNYADNFIRFVTEAHIVYLAMKLLGIDDPSDSAPQVAVDASTKFLNDLCQDIVQHVWLMPSITDVKDVAEFATVEEADDVDTWCICGEGRPRFSLSCKMHAYTRLFSVSFRTFVITLRTCCGYDLIVCICRNLLPVYFLIFQLYLLFLLLPCLC